MSIALLRLRRLTVAGWATLWTVCGLGLSLPPLYGQGSLGLVGLTVLRTGVGQVLQSSIEPVFVAPELASPALRFCFGFETDETWGPGQILDSFTITLQDNRGRRTEVYVTADASGVVWAPNTAGGAVLDPNSITRSPIASPLPGPAMKTRVAYQARIPVSAAFVGQPLSLYFDLFDNQNLPGSAGWFSDVAVVPEPQPWTLGVLGACIGLLGRGLWKRSQP